MNAVAKLAIIVGGSIAGILASREAYKYVAKKTVTTMEISNLIQDKDGYYFDWRRDGKCTSKLKLALTGKAHLTQTLLGDWYLTQPTQSKTKFTREEVEYFLETVGIMSNDYALLDYGDTWTMRRAPTASDLSEISDELPVDDVAQPVPTPIETTVEPVIYHTTEAVQETPKKK